MSEPRRLPQYAQAVTVPHAANAARSSRSWSRAVAVKGATQTRGPCSMDRGIGAISLAKPGEAATTPGGPPWTRRGFSVAGFGLSSA
eukprot:scaffold81103_cov28-Tisochrysis_lutea.AAC.4